MTHPPRHTTARDDWRTCIPVLITYDAPPPPHIQDQLEAVITGIVHGMTDRQRIELHLAACCGDTRYKQALLDFVRLLRAKGGSLLG